MSKRILIDNHHEGLTESLYKLFQDRLGYQVFTPLGMDWYREGYWAINNIEATAIQFLEAGSRPYPEYEPLNHKNTISLTDFKNTTFDLILASIPQHAVPFIKLRDLYQPQAKLIMQIGNDWPFDHNFPIKNILASAKIVQPLGFHILEYHQEFDRALYHAEPPRLKKKISSFINCLPVISLYEEDWKLFLRLEQLLPDWTFKSYGGQCRDGALGTQAEVAEATLDSDFIFASKKNGDGYGYGMFTAAACGRPLITRASDYQHKLAAPLVTDALTAITVDNRTPDQIAEIVRADYQTLGTLSGNIHRKFVEMVDFDKEEIAIRQFLDNLL